MNQPKVIQFSRSGSVRLIDEKGGQLGIVSVDDALNAANERSLDLVEVAPQANPPVCKLIDYGKMMYEQSKKQKPSKSVHRKEIRMGIRIGDNDMEVKLKRTEQFLDRGYEVQASVFLKGREKAHPEAAIEVLGRFMEKIEERTSVKILRQLAGQGNKAEVLFTR